METKVTYIKHMDECDCWSEANAIEEVFVESLGDVRYLCSIEHVNYELGDSSIRIVSGNHGKPLLTMFSWRDGWNYCWIQITEYITFKEDFIKKVKGDKK